MDLLMFYINRGNISTETLMAFLDYKCHKAVVNSTVATYLFLILET